MQRKAPILAVAALAAATAATPAFSKGHKGIEIILASYMPQIEALQDNALKAELQQRASLLKGYFQICATAENHSPELYAMMGEQLAEIAAMLNHTPEQTQLALAEAAAMDAQAR